MLTDITEVTNRLFNFLVCGRKDIFLNIFGILYIDACTNFSEVLTTLISRLLPSQILLMDLMLGHDFQ